jgi:hypothetical protein
MKEITILLTIVLHLAIVKLLGWATISWFTVLSPAIVYYSGLGIAFHWLLQRPHRRDALIKRLASLEEE